MTDDPSASVLPEPTVAVAEIDVRNSLAELNLSWEQHLKPAIIEGEELRHECTESFPRGAGGYFSYAGTTAGLRGVLRQPGWTRLDEENLAMTVHPTGRFAITVCSGDEGTGIWPSRVKTKYRKGTATLRVVEVNVQLELFALNNADAREDARAYRETWLLLRRRDGNTLRSELSKPLGITATGAFARGPSGSSCLRSRSMSRSPMKSRPTRSIST
jgi:hypothetical protein